MTMGIIKTTTLENIFYANSIHEKLAYDAVVEYTTQDNQFSKKARKNFADVFLRKALIQTNAKNYFDSYIQKIAILDGMLAYTSKQLKKTYGLKNNGGKLKVKDWIKAQENKKKSPDLLIIGVYNPKNIIPSSSIPIVYFTKGFNGLEFNQESLKEKKLSFHEWCKKIK